MEAPVFWIGPMGGMIPLVCPEAGVSNSIQKQAASNTSVNGRNTVDVQGYRRTWGISNAYLDGDDVSALEAIYAGAVKPPHRIIDPLKKNRLRPSVSAPRRTSTWNGGARSWHLESGNGIVTDLDSRDFPAVEFTNADGAAVSYRPDTAINWQVPSGSGGLLLPNGPLVDGVLHLPSRVDPVIPGETVTLSFYAKVSGTAPKGALWIHQLDADGVPVDGSGQQFTNTSWSRITRTYTAPEDGSVVGLHIYFEAFPGTTNIHIGPGQLESGAMATPWQFGYGAPTVEITAMETTSQRYPLTDVNLTILEL